MTPAQPGQPWPLSNGAAESETMSYLLAHPDLLHELIEDLIEQQSGWMCELRSAIERRDAQALAKTAHLLKGTVSVFAARRAEQLARQLEALAASGDLTGATAVLADLRGELDRMIGDLAMIGSP